MRCDCPQVCRDHPDKTFEELIEMGLICDVCANSYREFSKIMEGEEET
ncbi:MAG: hypothetical protein PHO02_04625 [Candidatus Nanoarchaeia archaeon]|nr:hypothetical protein [Candidatus Nanoarchaeia archaeon]